MLGRHFTLQAVRQDDKFGAFGKRAHILVSEHRLSGQPNDAVERVRLDLLMMIASSICEYESSTGP